jgi:phage terminase large subunit-like protein
MLHSSDLKSLPKEQVQEVLSKLSPQEWEELRYNWAFWARPNQLAPEGDWKILLALAGRGFGKTRMGTEWVRSMIKKGHTGYWLCCTYKG